MLLVMTLADDRNRLRNIEETEKAKRELLDKVRVSKEDMSKSRCKPT